MRRRGAGLIAALGRPRSCRRRAVRHHLPRVAHGLRDAPPEGLDLVVLALESSRGLPAIDDRVFARRFCPEGSPRKKRKEPEQASSLPAAADVRWRRPASVAYRRLRAA